MKKVNWSLCVMAMLLAGIFSTINLEAAETKKTKNVPEKTVDKMGMKMVRGICNAATGWCEIPRQIIRSAEKDGPALMIPYGLGRGVIMTVVRTTYGVLETAFCYIPFTGDYESELKPAYVWQPDPDDE